MSVLKNRVGEKREMNCGMTAEIISYKNASDINVRFTDGTVVHNMQYGNFKRGAVSCNKKITYNIQLAKKRLHEKRKMNCGLMAEIVEYNGTKDITVKFETGEIKRGMQYGNFKRGGVYPTDYRELRIGESKLMNNGKMCKIIDYRSYASIDVEWEDGTKVYDIEYIRFQSGSLRYRKKG